MTKHNAENERIKRKYFAFLKDAKRLSVQSVDGVASAISRYEGYTKYKDFRTFNADQVSAFKKHIAEQKGQRTGKNLSKATLHATFNQLKQFFQWLSREPGYKTRIQYSDAEYFICPGMTPTSQQQSGNNAGRRWSRSSTHWT